MEDDDSREVSIQSLLDSGAIISHKDGNYGSNYPRVEEFGSTGVPFLTAKSLSNGYVDIAGSPRLNDERAESLRFGFVETGDVLLSHNATIGRVAVVPEYPDRLLISTSLTYFRLNPRKILPRFFAVCLAGKAFQDELMAVMSHSTRNQVPITAQRKLKVVIPPLPEQRAIAHILGTLDDKIELNRRMNETLEAMARALFQSWFVDFDPVHRNIQRAQGHTPPNQHLAEFDALFPDEFENSELGMVPKGWRARKLGAFCEVAIGGDWGQDEAFEGAIAVRCLRGVDLEHLRFSGQANAPKRWCKPTSVARRSLDQCDVLVAGSGAGPTGRPLWVSPGLESVFDLPVVYSNFCKRLRCASPDHALYLDRWLHDMRESGEIWDFVNGTSVPNLDAQALLNGKEIVFPPNEVLEQFRSFAMPIIKRMYSGESRTLAALRDTLLPKLISGELRVKDAERFVEAAV